MHLRQVILAGVAVVSMSTALSAPASGVDLGLRAGGTVTVYPDLTACATVTYPSATTFSGVFAAEGLLQGPGTIVGPVAGAVPVSGVNVTTWNRCIAGAYAGATIGSVVYEFTVSSVAGDFVSITQCTVNSGAITCV